MLCKKIVFLDIQKITNLKNWAFFPNFFAFTSHILHIYKRSMYMYKHNKRKREKCLKNHTTHFSHIEHTHMQASVCRFYSMRYFSLYRRPFGGG